MFFLYVIEAMVALFAIFGFYCMIKLFCELLFAPSQLAVAVEVRAREDAEMLDMLLREAQGSLLRIGRARLVVLLSYELMDGTVGIGEELLPHYKELLEQFDAECYLIEP